MMTTTTQKYHLQNPSNQRCNSKLLTLAILQLVFAASIIILQVCLLTNGYYLFSASIGSGIWCGLVFAIAAGIELVLVSRKKQSRSWLLAHMWMNIGAAVFTIPLIIFAAIGINESNEWAMTIVIICICQLLIGVCQAIVAIINCISSYRKL